MRTSLFIAILFLAHSALAQADDLTYSDFEAARFLNAEDDKLADRTSSVREYSTAELRVLGASNLADALAMIAEGNVLTGDRFILRQETYLRLRGADPRSVRIFLDGVPLLDAQYQTSDLTRIAIGQIALIRVTTGPGSLRWGPGSTGGTIEIITRQVADKFSADFETDWGIGRALSYDLWLGDTQGPLNYYGAATHNERAGYFLPDDFEAVPDEDGGLRENAAQRQNHFLGRTGLILGVPIQFFIGGSYDEGENDIPRPLNSPNNIAYRYAHRRRSVGNFHLLAKPSKHLEIRALAYISENASRLERWLDKYAINDLDEQFHREDLRVGASLMPTLDFGKYSRIRLTGHYVSDKTSNWRQSADQITGNYQTTHLAIEDDVHLTKYVGVSAGFAFDEMMPIKADNVEDDELQTLSAMSFRAGMVAGPFAGADFHLAYAQKPRFPSPYELFESNEASPELDPEMTGQYEIGYSQEIGERASWSITGFRSETADVITEPADLPAAELGRIKNYGDKTLNGATVQLKTTPIEGLYARADYTYLDAVFEPKDKVSGEESSDVFFVPEHVVHAIAGYLSSTGFGGALGFSYTDGVADYESEDLGKLSYYGLFHARLFYNYRDNLEISIAGENLTDEYYESARHYPAPGRFLHGGIRLMF